MEMAMEGMVLDLEATALDLEATALDLVAMALDLVHTPTRMTTCRSEGVTLVATLVMVSGTLTIKAETEL
jgi:hypothetical protein